MNGRRRALGFGVAVSAFAVAAVHVLVLSWASHDPWVTPISALSRGPGAALQTAALVLFGGAHFALAVALGREDSGRLWPWGRALLALAGVGVLYIAFRFATAPAASLQGPDANDPLSVVASLTGLAMGALWPGLRREFPRLARFDAACLAAWILLLLIVPLVGPQWLGAYERMVGVTYVAWLGGMGLGLGWTGPGRDQGAR